MSDKNTSPININVPVVPESVDNAVKNLTDAPSKEIGKTFSDVWYLVFGGLSQKAAMRRMKYEHKLELYYQELQDSISKIPKEKKLEPDIQVTAQALENSKYCVESEELRNMFINLISKSMNSDFKNEIHPSFAEIIKQMRSTDAQIFKSLSSCRSFPLVYYIHRDHDGNKYTVQFSTAYMPSIPDITIEVASSSISSLSRLGLIDIDSQVPLASPDLYEPYKKTNLYRGFSIGAQLASPPKKVDILKYSGHITPLGLNFLQVCVE